MRLSSVLDPLRCVVDLHSDGQRRIVHAGHPVIRQDPTPPPPARAFWIGVLIGLVLVGLAFAVT